MKFTVAARFALIALGFGFAASILIAAPVKLNGTLPLGGDVDPAFQFSADSSRVLYVADQEALSYHCAARRGR